MNILYIALKLVIWRFRICNYFREMFKFRNFMSTLRNFEKSVLLVFSQNLNISRNNPYQRNLQITCFKMMYNMFIFLKFEIFSDCHSEAFVESFRKMLIKSGNHNIFEKFKLNRNPRRISFKIMYLSMLRHWFSNERCGGGGGALNHLALLFCKKVCNSTILQ